MKCLCAAAGKCRRTDFPLNGEPDGNNRAAAEKRGTAETVNNQNNTMEAPEVNKTHFSNANKGPIQRFFIRVTTVSGLFPETVPNEMDMNAFYLCCDIKS